MQAFFIGIWEKVISHSQTVPHFSYDFRRDGPIESENKAGFVPVTEWSIFERYKVSTAQKKSLKTQILGSASNCKGLRALLPPLFTFYADFRTFEQ